MSYGPFGVQYKKATTAPVARLLEETKVEEGEFVYCQADGAIPRGGFCVISPAGQAVAITTAASGAALQMVGCCQVTDGAADNEYFWAFRKGGGTGKGIVGLMAATVLVDSVLETTAGVAGELDDTSGSGDVVRGVRNLAATSGAAGVVEIWVPREMYTNG